MSDIKLTKGGDIDLTSGRVTLLPTEQESTTQRLLIKLKTYRGEWYLDISQGIPYFQRIFQRGGNVKSVADTVIKNAIQNDEGVISLDSFESTLSPSGNYSLNFKVTSISGDIVSVQQNIEF